MDGADIEVAFHLLNQETIEPCRGLITQRPKSTFMQFAASFSFDYGLIAFAPV